MKSYEIHVFTVAITRDNPRLPGLIQACHEGFDKVAMCLAKKTSEGWQLLVVSDSLIVVYDGFMVVYGGL